MLPSGASTASPVEKEKGKIGPKAAAVPVRPGGRAGGWVVGLGWLALHAQNRRRHQLLPSSEQLSACMTCGLPVPVHD